MAKARKEQFEGQLRDLQKDISNLSQRLATPTLVSSHPHSLHSYTRDNDITAHSADVLEDINKSVGSIGVKTDRGDKMAKILQEAHLAKKERDDAIYRLELAKQEIDELRKGLQESARLKAAFEHLRQDYESVKVSLESSERIRKQQKELINLLQKSHSIAVASDSASVFSINSISTISHAGHGHPADVSTASFAAENKEWLSAAQHGCKAAHNNPLPSQRRNSQVVQANISHMNSPTASNTATDEINGRSNTTAQRQRTTVNERPPIVPRSRASRNAPNTTSYLNSSSVVPIASISTTVKSQRSTPSPTPSQVIATTTKGSNPTGSKKKLRPKKKKSASNASLTFPVDYTPREDLPPYEEILSRNISLVPHMNNDPLHTSALSGSTTGNILNQSVGSIGFSGTDTSNSYPTPSINSLYGNGLNSNGNISAVQQYQYQHVPLTAGPENSINMSGKPPRYPGYFPASTTTSRIDPSRTAQSNTIPIYIPVAHPEVPSRPTTAPTSAITRTGRTPSPNTTSRRRNSASLVTSVSASGSTVKKSPALVRRIPGSTAKPRAQSTPHSRTPVSTFGAASRKL